MELNVFHVRVHGKPGIYRSDACYKKIQSN